MKLSKILTPYCYQLLQYWKSVDNGIISREKSKRIFVLLAANYGNIGDIAITIAQKKLLTDLCKDFEIVLMPSTSSFSDLKSLVKNIGKNDILTFVGGGNCGDLYYSYEIYRQLVVELLPKNKIVVFPQSIKFTEKKNFLRAKKHYGKAKENLTFCARELDSFKLAKELCYLNSVVLLPDVVFTMSYFHDLSNREGIMTCLRTDKERYLTDYDHSMIFSSLAKYSNNIEISDTYSNINMSIDDIYSYFNSFVDKIIKKQLLVTDRLHGMILGYITGTPTVVLPNSNTKIRLSYQFIKDCNYIYFIDDLSRFQLVINEILNVIPDYNYFYKRHNDIYQKFVSVVNSIIK